MPPAEVAGETTSTSPAAPNAPERTAASASGADSGSGAAADGANGAREVASAARQSDVPSPSGGSPIGTVVGLGLVAVLGALAVMVVRRRRLRDA